MTWLVDLIFFLIGVVLGVPALAAVYGLIDLDSSSAPEKKLVFQRIALMGLVIPGTAWLAGGRRPVFWAGLGVYLAYYFLSYLAIKRIQQRNQRLALSPADQDK